MAELIVQHRDLFALVAFLGGWAVAMLTGLFFIRAAS